MDSLKFLGFDWRKLGVGGFDWVLNGFEEFLGFDEGGLEKFKSGISSILNFLPYNAKYS